MSRQVAALAVVLSLAGAFAARAHADVYTWVDAAGNVNVSNLAPPAGTRVKSIAREDPDAKARAEAARAAAKDTQLRAFADRVAELERANEAPAGPPPFPYAMGSPFYGMAPPYAAPYGGPPPAPAPRFSVATMSSAPPDDAPSFFPACGSLDCVPMLGSPFYAPAVVVIPAFQQHHHHGHGTRHAGLPAMHPSPRGSRGKWR